MSIDLNWETLTTGPDGDALAERIRSFVHAKFQTVPLPRFIKSVNVHDFGFGTIPPQLDLKDVTDPLPDFYEDDEDGDFTDSDDGDDEADFRSSTRGDTPVDDVLHQHRRGRSHADSLKRLKTDGHGMPHDMASSFLGASTPGIMGGPGLNYFQGQFGTGTHTPLAAVAGAHMSTNWLGSPLSPEADIVGGTPSHSRQPSQSSISVDYNFMGAASTPTAAQPPGLASPGRGLKEKSSVSTLAPTASSVGTSRPPTRDAQLGGSAIVEEDDEAQDQGFGQTGGTEEPHHRREPRAEDVQAVFRILYSGDVRLNLTAEILLDYPMPSFVGIPLKLNITGLSFDGVGVLAKIRKRLNFCFLSPDDALAAVGPDNTDQDEEGSRSREKGARFGGLLQEIRVESEIGERQGGKQSLKNVGKVERFVLDQIRRIFEEELVYPSFWTFLV